MKIGDKVKLNDHSGNLAIVNGELKHNSAYGGYYSNDDLRVSVINGVGFPTFNPLRFENYPQNDTIVYSKTHDQFFYTNSKYLSVIEEKKKEEIINEDQIRKIVRNEMSNVKKTPRHGESWNKFEASMVEEKLNSLVQELATKTGRGLLAIKYRFAQILKEQGIHGL